MVRGRGRERLDGGRPGGAVVACPAIEVAGDGRSHHVLLRHLVAAEQRHRVPLVHDEDPVAEADQLEGVRGDEQDRRAVRGKLPQQPVDFLFRADVDAARRLGQEVDTRLQRQPLGDGDLLLIATAQTEHGLPRRLQTDAELGDEAVDQMPLARPAEDASPVELAERRQREVLTDRQLHDQAVCLAVLGDVSDPLVHRAARVTDGRGLAVEMNLALDRMEPEERGQQFALALPLQPTQAENLALVQLERDVPELLAGAEVPHGEHDRGREQIGQRRFRRKDVPHLAPDHMLHEVSRRRPGGRNGDHVRAVFEDGDAVGDGEDFLQPVGDEDDADPLLPQAAKRGE